MSIHAGMYSGMGIQDWYEYQMTWYEYHRPGMGIGMSIQHEYHFNTSMSIHTSMGFSMIMGNSQYDYHKNPFMSIQIRQYGNRYVYGL